MSVIIWCIRILWCIQRTTNETQLKEKWTYHWLVTQFQPFAPPEWRANRQMFPLSIVTFHNTHTLTYVYTPSITYQTLGLNNSVWTQAHRHILKHMHAYLLKQTHTLIASAGALLKHKLLSGWAFKHPDTLVTVQCLKRLPAEESPRSNTTWISTDKPT